MTGLSWSAVTEGSRRRFHFRPVPRPWTRARLRRHLLPLVLFSLSESALAQTNTFSMAPQPLSKALNRLGSQADITLMYRPAQVDGLQAPALSGTYSPDQALTELLRDSGLGFRHTDARIYVITDPATPSAPVATTVLQRPPAIEPDVAAVELPSVTVTARRRPEPEQNVPLAISAFSGDALQTDGVRDAVDLQYLVPSLTVAGQISWASPSTIIRGQRRSVVGGSLPGVLTYLGEVPMPSAGNLMPMFDIATVQVLKGPQGTLFGRNVTGGAVLVDPAQPQPGANEATLSASLGNLDSRTLNASFNLALAENWALRVAVHDNRRNGYTHALSTGQWLDDDHEQAWRISLLATPWPGFSSLTVADGLRSHSNGTGLVPSGAYSGGILREAEYAAYFDSNDGNAATDIDEQQNWQQQAGVRSTRPDIRQYERRYLGGIANTTEMAFPTVGGSLRLRNIAALRAVRTDTALDLDGTPLPVMERLDSPGFSDEDRLQLSNELQLLGHDTPNDLDWILGAFWLQDRPGGPAAITERLYAKPDNDGISTTRTISSDLSRALFAQLGWGLIPQTLRLTAGLRYTWDSRHYCVAEQAGRALPAAADCSPHSAAHFSAPTWTLGLDWRPSENQLVYLVTRRGFRSGGINADVPAGYGLETYQPETLTDVELGLKSDWHGDGWSARFNIAAYRGDYADVQRALTATVDRNGVTDSYSVVVNAEDSVIGGLELDSQWRSANWAANLAYDWMHSRVDAYVGPDFLATNSNVQQGTRFSYAPEHVVTLGLRRRLPLDAALGTLWAGTHWHWSDRYLLAPRSNWDPIATQPAFSLLDLHVDWDSAMGSPLKVSLVVRNATNTRYRTGSGVIATSLTTSSSIYGPPRIWGIDLRYQFQLP